MGEEELDALAEMDGITIPKQDHKIEQLTQEIKQIKSELHIKRQAVKTKKLEIAQHSNSREVAKKKLETAEKALSDNELVHRQAAATERELAGLSSNLSELA